MAIKLYPLTLGRSTHLLSSEEGSLKLVHNCVPVVSHHSVFKPCHWAEEVPWISKAICSYCVCVCVWRCGCVCMCGGMGVCVCVHVWRYGGVGVCACGGVCGGVCMCGGVGVWGCVKWNRPLAWQPCLLLFKKPLLYLKTGVLFLCVGSRKTCSTSYRNSRTVDSP